MNVTRILLVEDDSELCSAFQSFLSQVDDVILIDAVNNSAKAIEILFETFPDVLILDLELHNGGGSGLFVLDALSHNSFFKKPFILVMTNNSSRITLDKARELGADYIVLKHQSDFSVKTVIELVRLMKQHSEQHTETTDSPFHGQEMSVCLEKMIKTELNLIGISPKNKGYQYLTEAIKIAITKPQSHITGQIGSSLHVSAASVERAIACAINRAWVTTDTDDLFHNYTARISSAKGVPTPTEFIYFYAEKIKSELVLI